jgi:DNA ligase-1
VETVFPLSGHADHAGLRRYVKDSGADRIFLVGRSAAAFAAQLRDLGMDAWPLQPAQQLDLFHPGRLGAAS